MRSWLTRLLIQYNETREENKHLTVFITGNDIKENWSRQSRKNSFFNLKGIIESVLNRLGINRYRATSVKNDLFSEGIQYSQGKTVLVDFGIVKSKVTKHFDIAQEVLFADFNWDNIIEVAKHNKIKFTAIPKYPEVRRDFALLLDSNVTFEEINTIAKQTEKQLLKSVNLFDVYQGRKLPKGKKSYAVSFTFQDKNKTLTDKVVDKVMSKLQSNFENKLGAELR